MDLQQISVILGIAAGVTQVVGYVVYAKYSKDHANAGSWAIWTAGAGVDLASYALMTHDPIKSILPAVCAISCITLFIYMLARKQFGWPDKLDLALFGLDGLVTIAWYFTSATVASVLYQGSTVSSFIPMIRGQQSGKDDPEHPLPWLIWTVAYALMLVSVALRFDIWQELAFPVVHAGTHFAMFLVALRRARSQRPAH
ncbi:MAG: nuclear protein [Parcubacteria group bacterium]|nr:nuclear protein [Parcubacteria group bacterium]